MRREIGGIGRVAGRRTGTALFACLLALALLFAIAAETGASRATPWKGHWSGQGQNAAGPDFPARFKVDFDVSRTKMVFDLEVRRLYFHCQDQAATYHFPLIRFEKVDRIDQFRGPRGVVRLFRIRETFDRGTDFEYTATVSANFNRRWTRVVRGHLEISGPLVGSACSTELSWQGHHA
jgi:hypothetical protein